MLPAPHSNPNEQIYIGQSEVNDATSPRSQQEKKSQQEQGRNTFRSNLVKSEEPYSEKNPTIDKKFSNHIQVDENSYAERQALSSANAKSAFSKKNSEIKGAEASVPKQSTENEYEDDEYTSVSNNEVDEK